LGLQIKWGHRKEECDIMTLCYAVEEAFVDFVDKAAEGQVTAEDIEDLAEVVDNLLGRIKDDEEGRRGYKTIADRNSISKEGYDRHESGD